MERGKIQALENAMQEIKMVDRRVRERDNASFRMRADRPPERKLRHKDKGHKPQREERAKLKSDFCKSNRREKCHTMNKEMRKDKKKNQDRHEWDRRNNSRHRRRKSNQDYQHRRHMKHQHTSGDSRKGAKFFPSKCPRNDRAYYDDIVRQGRRNLKRELCGICTFYLYSGNLHDNLRTLHCGHKFHADCVRRWRTECSRCPRKSCVAGCSNHSR